MKLILFILIYHFANPLHSDPDAGYYPFEANRLSIRTLQQTETAFISGKVTDTKGNALMYASVFINNTTIGAITNKNGEYQLKNVPFGQHLLVISYVGYDFISISLNVNKPSVTRNLQLKQSKLEIDEVVVYDKISKNKWVKNLKKFEKNFIGESKNASSCKIINPKALIFHYDKETRVLTAKARGILVIENNGLGYTINYVLEKFELHKNNRFTYLCRKQFIPMKPENEVQAELWKKNRETAYKGSIQHFLRALVHNSLVEEGFVVKSSSSMFPVNNEKEVDYFLIQYPDPLETEIHIFPVSNNNERRFWYNNFLHVVYTKEPERYTYRAKFGPRYKIKSFQQSWIRLLKTDVSFNILGYLNDPLSTMFYGYWAFEKESEALPLDYSLDF